MLAELIKERGQELKKFISKIWEEEIDSPSWPRPPNFWGFKITLRHTKLGMSHLDK
jgi:hypothetical protein